MLNNKAENHLLVSKNRDVLINDYWYYINPVKSHSVNYNNNNNNNNNYNNNNLEGWIFHKKKDIW